MRRRSGHRPTATTSPGELQSVHGAPITKTSYRSSTRSLCDGRRERPAEIGRGLDGEGAWERQGRGNGC